MTISSRSRKGESLWHTQRWIHRPKVQSSEALHAQVGKKTTEEHRLWSIHEAWNPQVRCTIKKNLHDIVNIWVPGKLIWGGRQKGRLTSYIMTQYLGFKENSQLFWHKILYSYIRKNNVKLTIRTKVEQSKKDKPENNISCLNPSCKNNFSMYIRSEIL